MININDDDDNDDGINRNIFLRMMRRRKVVWTSNNFISLTGLTSEFPSI